VFDVKLQGKTVLERFDIAREAGGPWKALVREFSHVPAEEAMTLEFVPAGKIISAKTPLPLLCGLEVYDEGFKKAAWP
jgi:hypothetical protein